MKLSSWGIEAQEYQPEKRYSRDALFTVGNGYFGVRGFFEEDSNGIGGLGGIYMAGVFGMGGHDAWEGKSRELCNVSNILRLRLTVNGETVSPTGKAKFSQKIDMRHATYTRSYEWEGKRGEKLLFTFQRFASLANIHEIHQRVIVDVLKEKVELELGALMDSAVTNLNWESCEPLPVQPGRNHIRRRRLTEDTLCTELDDVDGTILYFAQKTQGEKNGEPVCGFPVQTDMVCGQKFTVSLSAGDKFVLKKAVRAYTTKDEADEVWKQQKFLAAPVDYENDFESHADVWKRKWQESDIAIDAPEEDQAALRYNIFHLLSVCPKHTDRLSIGARGLTGEMYEGCVFWDNEIFQLPFYLYTDPDAARRLLNFRYHTLDAARRHAKKNWFEGAMYPWQVSEKGVEQTPYNVGAFYAVHIVGDIAYAIREYWQTTGNDDFMLHCGGEMLLETARFWASRSDFDESDGKYHIRAVRGPNEYDVYVNDNAYTNVMAVQNLQTAESAVRALLKKYPEETRDLLVRLHVAPEERACWEKIALSMSIPYNKELDLYEEDDAYLRRRPLDLKKAKPTGKRIIDSTLPYEALPLYQVTKQADVILLMNMLSHLFTKQQKMNAYHFYEPRTAHDSSLSYAPHGVMAANIGIKDEAYRYFKKSAFLDINDIQLNTVSGLHFANFGGTWQLAVCGFAGISQDDGVLYISPNLPDAWKGFVTSCQFRGSALKIEINRSGLRVSLKNPVSTDNVRVNLCGSKFCLTMDYPEATVESEEKS